MRRVSRVITAAALALFIAGCSSSPFGNVDLRTYAWADAAGRDLACRGGTVQQQGRPDLYDINRDGHADAFVVMRCVTGNRQKSAYGQFEVFSGAQDPELSPLAVIVYREEGVKLDDRFRFDTGSVTIKGTRKGVSVTCTAHWRNGLLLLGNLPDTSAPSACS